MLRLVTSRDQSYSELRYATLSHCWGAKLPIFTSKATRLDFQKCIPEDTLPQTFRDAVHIARSLDIPYLWIDALCIVQDDVDEWQNEAAKMHHIYSGSVLTIAASEAEDSTGGCFMRQSSLLSSSVNGRAKPVKETQDMHSNRNAYSSYEEALLDVPGGDSKVMVRVQSGAPWSIQRRKPLSSRGWVLQEQLLSNRIVHCMQSEIHWQCRRAYRTQAGQMFDNDTLLQDRHNFSWSPSKRRERTWCSWVEEYSTRNFTFIDDRVPALAGIANHYASTTGDSHLLGLWRKTFSRDLLWIRVNDIKGHPCPSIPSWTWLSCYAPIEIDPFTKNMFDEDQKEDHIVLQEGNVSWSGPPMTSKIQSTRLVISGPLQTLRLRVDPKAKAKANFPCLHFEGEELDETGSHLWTGIGQFDAEEPSPGEYVDYPCLLVRTRKRDDQGRFKEAFLILEEVVDASCYDSREEPPVFRRIGIACKRGVKQTFRSAKNMTIRLS
ncbi:heterokaryon incompatibility protein [Fusarium austroafricanum]|uniref:Heterokaryon incompatibility protein n=1 Tax=Fusarium austroafricanum TaxID=2364996 RepID=A0A8H4KCD2_9HYPO|nr:heterokaryon incompatibility protein [Fusarium austroafricanum]